MKEQIAPLSHVREISTKVAEVLSDRRFAGGGASLVSRVLKSLARRPKCEARGREQPERTRAYVRIASGRAKNQFGPAAAFQHPVRQGYSLIAATGANKTVGPSLAGIATRKYLAGVIPNSPDNMIRWLRFPQQIAPQSAMPDLGVAERDARDMAMFLETLK